jgi:hypothetical protein
MPFIQVTNRDGKPLSAEIYKDSALVGITNAQGELELPLGDFKAKAIGYDSKSFRVPNQAKRVPVNMRLLSEVNQPEQGFFKNLKQQDWLVLIAVSVVVVSFATFYTIKKRKNAKS